MKPILCAHNAATGNKPRRWIDYLMIPIGRCQENEIYGLSVVRGVSAFDIRIRFDRNDFPYYCHGLMKFKGDLFKDLELLSSLTEYGNIYVRLVLEDFKCSKGKQDGLFEALCHELKKMFPKIKFYGGVRKSDWKHIAPCIPFYVYPEYNFFGSFNREARWYEKIFPGLYAKRMNESVLNNIEKYPNDYQGFVLMDYL